MAYDTTEAVAKFLSGFQMKITNRERDTVAPDYYVKYSLTLSKGGKDFSTTFVSDPRASGEPTVTQVFSALADDALTLRKYSTDEFVDKLYAQGVKPSAALRAYDSCKETNLWMQDELYLSGWEIEEISKTLTKHGDEVNALVEKAASERAARYAYDHPKLPKGFVTITQLQGSITRIICPSKGLPPWESTMSLATRTGSSTTSITARNSAPPLVTWNSPSDALLRNTKKRKGRSLTTSPPANGVCILSTPESVTVSMVA